MTPDLLILTILAGAASTLLAAGVVAIFYKPVREKFWKPIGRAIRWPFSLRVTTAARQAIAAKDLADANEAATTYMVSSNNVRHVASAEVAAAHDAARAEIDAVKALAEQYAGEARNTWALEVQTANRESLARGRAEGRAEALAEIAAQRATPRLKPVWRVLPSEGEIGFYLRNTQSGVDVADISIAAPLDSFQFLGDTQWLGDFSGSQIFFGKKLRRGQTFGVDFTIQYTDANGDRQTGQARIDKEPRRATVL